MLLGIFFLCFISRHPGVKEFFILCLISSHPGVWRNFFILQLDQQSSLNLWEGGVGGGGGRELCLEKYTHLFEFGLLLLLLLFW